MRLLASVALMSLGACAGAPPDAAPVQQAAVTAAPVLTVEPYTFNGPNGVKVEAERGTFEVPENRSDPNSRKIKIGFVRFKSTSANPGDPIVYLAGGPGGTGTGTAQGARFPLFMALREVSDVIAYDQRGTGFSSPTPLCPATPPLDGTTFSREVIVSFYRDRLAKCFDQWEAKGIDIDGYTTLESAHDIEDLRKALGAKKLNLWGISYGSHLGLAFMKYHGGSVSRAVLSGIEGLDQTIKRPALTDEMFRRFQKVIDADPAAKAAYPDLAGMMRRVHAKLNAQPATVSFTPQGATAPVSVTFDGYMVQMLASQSIADPPATARLPQMYLALDKGMYERAAPLVWGMRQQVAGFRGMPDAMDLASGATAARLKLVTKEAETALLSDTLNFPMPQVMGIRPQIDLGDKFRAPFTSDIRALFISCTLDGRTYPEEAEEEIKGFRNRSRLIVENGGHNIYEADQRVADAVLAYFKGQPTPERIVMAPPKFPTP
ncbi:MAG TPA: alpha/beta fold hydrolase [Hyphomonadaceae bacterium]|nr:alpha/beta fold hydrolase [Hyphomonadaceae bacterium]